MSKRDVYVWCGYCDVLLSWLAEPNLYGTKTKCFKRSFERQDVLYIMEYEIDKKKWNIYLLITQLFQVNFLIFVVNRHIM